MSNLSYAPVSSLPILTEDDRRKILVEWNETTEPEVPLQRIHERVAAHAKLTPAALAVEYEGKSLTYSELDRRGNQIAHVLRKSHIGPDVLVGVCMERSTDLIAALLGILKAGGAYLPLDPTYPPERIAFMLEDAQVAVLLTESRFVSRFSNREGLRIINFDDDRAIIDCESVDEVPSILGESPENLAYVMYTSGSTGRPKGVAIEHRHVLDLLINTNYIQFTSEDRVAQTANAAFDGATFEIWGALLHGASLLGVARNVSLDPWALAAQLREQRISVIFLATALFNLVAREAPTAFESVRTIIAGGDAMDPQGARKVLENGPPERLLNGYGPTETTTFATWYQVTEVPAGATTIPIGRPLSRMAIYILDHNLSPVPIGVMGELYIGGDGVGRGYYRRPELSAEKFLHDPFSAKPGAKMYRTGDLAFFRPDGNIEFCGRADHQVKIRGFRIELGEITAVLGEHPAVREAVVVTWEKNPGEKSLLGYIVPNQDPIAALPDDSSLISVVRDYLKTRLPDYMVPSTFMLLDALPITPNGKIDRAKLPLPEMPRTRVERESAAASSELETQLTALWQELLGLEHIGIHDNFFELGGESLTAVKLFSRIRGMCSSEISFQALFSNPTIAGLAMLMSKETGVRVSERPIPVVSREGPLPLSFGQERLWFLQRLAPQGRAYNCLYPFRLTGTVNVAALHKSFRDLAQRHEILRTTFVEIDGRPTQVIAPHSLFRLEVIDLQHLSADEREDEARRYIDSEAQRIFDLERGPLFLGSLLRLGEEEHILWIHLHHLTIDGWSIELAFREVSKLYDAYERRIHASLPELRIQYVDFAVWQREQMSDSALIELLAWWKQKLHGAPPLLDLPGDHARPAVQSFRGETLHFKLEQSLGGALKELSRRNEMTLMMVLMGAFAVLIHRYTQRDDLLIGIPSANRSRTDLEGIMGFFVNTVPIRMDFSGDPTFDEVLQRVRNVCLESYEHDMLPFERLVQELQPDRDLSYNPLVQIVFGPQPPAERVLELPGMAIQHIEVDTKKTIFDICLYAWESTDGVVGMLEYSTDLFERPTMSRMLDHLFKVLEAGTSDPCRRLSSLPMLALQDANLHTEHVAEWHDLYEAAFGKDQSGVDPHFNITGWQSSYTGKLIEPSDMRVWRDATVERILGFQPRRVWEIGCGTGLLLLQVAPQCAEYFGTDFSQQVLSLLSPHVIQGELAHVALQQREANDFTGIEPGKFDAVVLNSIVQYFPSADYLHAVLQGAVQAVGSSGIVFVGDVRSFPLLAAFETSVQVQRAAPEHSVAELRNRVDRAISTEGELLLAPDFFRDLSKQIPGVAHAEVWLKRGRGADEMTRYRYDVVLYVGDAPEPVLINRKLDWNNVGEIGALERILRDEIPDALEVLGIPNARVYADVLAAQELQNANGRLREFVGKIDLEANIAIQPELFWELGARGGYSVRITWSRTAGHGCMDVLFERAGDSLKPRPWIHSPASESLSSSHANHPLRAKQLRALPLSGEKKIDNRGLDAPLQAEGRKQETPDSETLLSHVEAILREIWCKVLTLDHVGPDDAFFELGGHSLLLARVRTAIRVQLHRHVPIVDLFEYPTIRSLAAHLRTIPVIADSSETAVSQSKPAAVSAPAPIHAPALNRSPGSSHVPAAVRAPSLSSRSVAPRQGVIPAEAIAVIGMAGRFPKAADIDAFWDNLQSGVEGISFFTREELAEFGVDSELVQSPKLVPAYGVLQDAVGFDAAFFGFSPHEARMMDPQHRVFLECAWNAMEDSGYNSFSYARPIGIFAGCDVPNYWLERIGLPKAMLSSDHYQKLIGNGGDGLTTRVAYRMGLRGPAITVQTACSTSLVAIHLACQSLALNESDMVLAGGVVALAPTKFGYVYEEGSVTSPDGHCRPFDAAGAGFVPGSGVGVVVLKRLRDALADGDTIRAVIRGSAVSNDGSAKIGYTAPGLDGQFETIMRAQAAAGVDPETITFVEAHGTATRLGDSIEVAALTKAFRQGTNQVGFCALGSAKGNIGHLGAAAGVTGLIKAVMSLEHECIPPTLHFQRPNPEIEFDGGPFFVNSTPREWPRGAQPRRAGVSAFGIGGTNAHVIVEEAPTPQHSGPSRRCQLLVLSAKSSEALDASAARLARHFEGKPHINLPDAAFTLQQGRVHWAHRRAIIAHAPSIAATRLHERDSLNTVDGFVGSRAPEVVFMFPGLGTQRLGMGHELYTQEPVYQQAIDECAALFQSELGVDIRTALFPKEQEHAATLKQLLRPSLNQAVIFSTEYALAQLLLGWGIRPAALTGHSMGEYVAACVAGILSLQDAVSLIVTRGHIYEELPEDSATLVVQLSEKALAERLGEGLSMAAVNGPEACVVSGTRAAVERLEADLQCEGVMTTRLPIAAAMHSSLVEPFMARLTAKAASITTKTPRIPMISNVTGTWITDAEIQDPSYWARHLRGTVRFADGLSTLMANPAYIFVEVGPGRTLTRLASRHPKADAKRFIVHSLTTAGSDRTDMEVLLSAIGRLWCVGIDIDWMAFSRNERRMRIPLPGYPFERIPYVFEPLPKESRAEAVPFRSVSLRDEVPASPAVAKESALVLENGRGAVEDHVTQTLSGLFQRVLGVENVRPQDNFFDLGGSSLSSIQLRAHIQEQFNIALPVHAILEYRTFAALADRIRRDLPSELCNVRCGCSSCGKRGSDQVGNHRSDVGSLLVRLQAGAPGRIPLFLIQPIGGTVYTYFHLSQKLDPDLPVYGIRASGMEPGEPIFDSMHGMAARYVEEIASIQPKGPYLLGGHSAGGAIAYEMAQQLITQGHEVPFLLIMDTLPLTTLKESTVEGYEALMYEVAKFANKGSQAYQGFVTALQDGTPFRSIALSIWRALAAYDVHPTRANLIYLSAREQPIVRQPYPVQYWMDLGLGTFANHNMPGDHFTMMEQPHVSSIAQVIRQHLGGLNP